MLICDIVVTSVTVIVICVLRKNLNNDITSYNYRVSQLEDIQDYDWKQLSGDVFRPPSKNVLLLSGMLGTVVQLLSMFTICLFLGVYINEQNNVYFLLKTSPKWSFDYFTNLWCMNFQNLKNFIILISFYFEVYYEEQ